MNPRPLLRLEGTAMLAVSVFAYHSDHGNWILFALLFLLPDVSMVGENAGEPRRAGTTQMTLTPDAQLKLPEKMAPSWCLKGRHKVFCTAQDFLERVSCPSGSRIKSGVSIECTASISSDAIQDLISSAECAAPNSFVGKFGKPSLDQIQP